MKVRRVIIVQNFSLDEFFFFLVCHTRTKANGIFTQTIAGEPWKLHLEALWPLAHLCTISISHFSALGLAPAFANAKKLCRLALRCCGENRGRNLAIVAAEISLSGAEVFNYGIPVVSGFKAAFSLLLFCITSRLFFCIYDPIGPCVCAWLWYDAKEAGQSIPEVFCFEPADRAADRLGWVVLGYKAPFVEHSHSRLSSLIRSVDFQCWLGLKDTTRHLRLSPRAPKSFDIKGANPTKLYFQPHIHHFTSFEAAGVLRHFCVK